MNDDKTTKHTPGPWTIVETGKTGLGEVVCEVGRGGDIDPRDEDSLYQVGRMCDWGGWDKETTLANARLIAAAPEMLAALEDILNGLEHAGCSSQHCSGTCHYCATRRRAREAIAKTEGI